MIFNSAAIKQKKLFIALLLLMLIVCIVYALTAGNYAISLKKIGEILLFKFFGRKSDTITKMDEIVFWTIRFPRVLNAMFIGFALSAAGTAYQGCFRNPLVEPFILGASSGAAFGAAVGIVFNKFFLSISVSAFIFSLAAVAISYLLARNKNGVPVVALILSGVIVGSIFSAFVSLIKYVSEDTQLREITFWMMGGLYYSTWNDIQFNAPIISAGFFLIWILSWKLNLLSLGDRDAKSLGIHPERYKFIFIVLATLLTSVSVSGAGIIAWIGLMMPHAARLLMGPDNRFVVPVSAILGALYLILCDTAARTITTAEVPVGIITSIAGAPFLLFLLRSNRKELLK